MDNGHWGKLSLYFFNLNFLEIIWEHTYFFDNQKPRAVLVNTTITHIKTFIQFFLVYILGIA